MTPSTSAPAATSGSTRILAHDCAALAQAFELGLGVDELALRGHVAFDEDGGCGGAALPRPRSAARSRRALSRMVVRSACGSVGSIRASRSPFLTAWPMRGSPSSGAITRPPLMLCTRPLRFGSAMTRPIRLTALLRRLRPWSWSVRTSSSRWVGFGTNTCPSGSRRGVSPAGQRRLGGLVAVVVAFVAEGVGGRDDEDEEGEAADRNELAPAADREAEQEPERKREPGDQVGSGYVGISDAKRRQALQRLERRWALRGGSRRGALGGKLQRPDQQVVAARGRRWRRSVRAGPRRRTFAEATV